MKATLPYTIAVGFGMMAATGASAQTQNPPGVNPQHYECYNVDDPRPSPERKVALQDQFGRSEAVAGKPVLLCNPVSKNRELVKDKLTHLVCYEIREGRFAPKRVEAVNQFGIDTLSVDVPRMLCVPSLKRIVG
jgi:hypothetical protein